MIRPLGPWPDPRLSRAAALVEAIDAAVLSLWDDMIDTMDAMSRPPGGCVGLAAPQIGVMLRLAVVDASFGRGQAVRLANPEIVEASDDLSTWEEASPNISGASAKVRRPAWVGVRYLDTSGASATGRFEGLWATSVQHQIDHLDGRMFLDRLSPLKRKMALKRAVKRAG